MDRKPPANTAAQNPPNRPRFFNAQQQDPSQIQPRLKGQTPATGAKPPTVSKTQFGTHELAVKEAQSKGRVWGRMPPSAVVVLVQRPTTFSGQQGEPDRIQPVIHRGAQIASAAVQSAPVRPIFFAGQQLEPDRQQALILKQSPPPTIFANRIFARGQQFPPEVVTTFITSIGPPEALGISAMFFAGQQAEPDRQQALFVGQQPASAIAQDSPNRPAFFSGQQPEPERQQALINRQQPPPTAPTPPPLTSAKLYGQQGEPDRIQAQIFRQAPAPLIVVRWSFLAGQQGEPDRQQALFIRQPPISIAPSNPQPGSTFLVGQQFDDGRQIPSWIAGQQPPGAAATGTITIVDRTVRFGQVVGVVSVEFGQVDERTIRFTDFLEVTEVKF
jgi:hypothetical protein